MDVLEVVRSIKEEIEKKGAISFEQFMEIALYLPGYGYYMRDRLPWGKKGDYYTASWLHKFFGIAVGVQLKEFWDLMGRPKNFLVVEGGPGDGSMAFDVLSYLEEFEKDLFLVLTYVLLERNPYLEKLQRKKLGRFEKVFWAKDISEVPNFSGAFISNELFDSFPVRRVVMNETLKEIYVKWEGDKFVEITKDASEEVLEYFYEFGVELKKEFVTEVCLKMREFIKEICVKLKEGFVYTVDYGYTADEYFSDAHAKGTLLCYHRHRTHENPYINIGDQDITAHVNFSSLCIYGEKNGLTTVGFASLGSYLVSLGLSGCFDKIFKMKFGLEDYLKIKSFLVPQSFGGTHKVLVQSKGIKNPNLKGFLLTNKKHLL